jgi:hypothetical protein
LQRIFFNRFLLHLYCTADIRTTGKLGAVVPGWGFFEGCVQDKGEWPAMQKLKKGTQVLPAVLLIPE